MQPKFKNQLAWEQAELLMQPALIRVIDNLRKELETSAWQGTYQQMQTPYPGYQLCLTRGDLTFNLDIWQLCFQVCFLNYRPEMTTEVVEIDTSLIDEVGEVDWENLEAKTQQMIHDIFVHLP